MPPDDEKTELPGDWRLRAACRDVDADLWSREDVVSRSEARHICVHHCPVLAECLDYARRVPPSYVVMGGLSWAAGGRVNGQSQPVSARCRLCPSGGPAPDADRFPSGGGVVAVVGLSARLMDTLRLLARGCTNVEIARELHLTQMSADSQVKDLLRELSARNRTHAVALGYQTGLLPTP